MRFSPFSNTDYAPKKLDTGCVDPAGIELQIRDLNLNGLVEPVLKYADQEYLIKWDMGKKNVYLVPYERKIELLEKSKQFKP